MKTLTVHASETYDILIGENILASALAPEELAEEQNKNMNEDTGPVMEM